MARIRLNTARVSPALASAANDGFAMDPRPAFRQARFLARSRGAMSVASQYHGDALPGPNDPLSARSRHSKLAPTFFLLQAMGALGFVDRMIYGQWEGKSGDTLTQGLNLLLAVTSIAMFVGGLRGARSIGAGRFLALALVGFLLLSTAWSIDPQTTIRRAVLYLIVVIGAIGIAGTLDDDEFIDLLALTCFAAAAASLALLVFSPTVALDPNSTSLRGIFPQKNVLGQVMAAGAIASLHGMRISRGGRRLRNVLMLIVFGAVCAAARSTTSLTTILELCCASGVVALWRKGGARRVLGIFLMIFLVSTLVIVVVYPDPILEFIGKDPTLTGRTDLWSYVVNYIYERPMLGWGYSAFWPNSPPAVEISNALRWSVPSAHNGLLELLLNMGLVGAVFVVCLLVRSVVWAIRCLHTSKNELAISFLLSCGGIILIGISEPVLTEPFDISTSMFFIMGMMCERTARVERRERAWRPRMTLPSQPAFAPRAR